MRLPKWIKETFPYELREDIRWSWIIENSDPNKKNVFWWHLCNEKPSNMWIDVSSGQKHTLVSSNPLHIEPSILCPNCGLHGYVRNGVWVDV